MLPPIIREPWMDSALCTQADPDAWFPDQGGSAKEAKKVCRACPVAVECLDFALATNERFGIWGGLTELERRSLAKFREGHWGAA
jgi:WhiB family redox-sensing transcriptional regulator